MFKYNNKLNHNQHSSTAVNIFICLDGYIACVIPVSNNSLIIRYNWWLTEHPGCITAPFQFFSLIIWVLEKGCWAAGLKSWTDVWQHQGVCQGLRVYCGCCVQCVCYVSVLQVPALIKELETDGQSVVVVDRVSLSSGTASLLSWTFGFFSVYCS